MPTPKHPDIAALIAAAATMQAHGEPISMAVKETIGRAECARLGQDPDCGVNSSGVCGGAITPYWLQVADDAIVSHWAAEQTRRGLLVPSEIHARLETLERTLGLGAGFLSSHDPEFGYMVAWQEIVALLDLPAKPISPKQLHETVVMPQLRTIIGMWKRGS